MEESEVEILEPNYSYEKEIPVLVRIKEVKDTNQQIIVNGVPQPIKSYLIHCPKCGRVIYNLNEPGTTMFLATRVCTANQKQLGEIATYCPKCGQKLKYDFGEPIDADMTEEEPQESKEDTSEQSENK